MADNRCIMLSSLLSNMLEGLNQVERRDFKSLNWTVHMSSFSYSDGGGVLSLRNIGILGGTQDSRRSAKVHRAKDLSILDAFDAEIDSNVNSVFNGVLEEITNFFLSSATLRENIFGLRRVSRKLKTAVVQCSAAEVGRLVHGVLSGLGREIGEHVVVKSGQTNINDVISRFEDCGGKKKQLLVIEQGESFSSQFFNGLFSSLADLTCEIIILLCISTKQIMFTSRVSRRTMSLLCIRRFLFCLSHETFNKMLADILLNPSYTDMRLHPLLLRFIRSSFCRDDFSVSSIKTCIRFALLHHLWTKSSFDSSEDESEDFISSTDKYLGVLRFLHDNIRLREQRKEYFSQLLKLHEDVQLNGFGAVASLPNYRDWMQSITSMCDDEIKQMLNYEGISSLNLKLQTCSEDRLERNEVELDKTSKTLNEKTTVLQLKNKMKEIIAARQRNPQLIARQKLIGDIENNFRSILQPTTSFPHARSFLIGNDTADFISPDTVSKVESSLAGTAGKNALTVAVRTLTSQGRWKTVSLAEWGKSFASEMMQQGLAKDIRSMDATFFACVGQLEYMGIIRASSSAKSPSVAIAYHLLNMSDEHDVIRGDSSSSISTSESFEKVAVPGASESSSRDSPAVSGNNSDAEHSETAPSVTVSEGEKRANNKSCAVVTPKRQKSHKMIGLADGTLYYVSLIAIMFAGGDSSMDDLIPNLRDERVQGAVKSLLVYSLVILLVPLGSMFILKQYFFEDLPVCLGFALPLELDNLYRLRSIFLPLGKIGGKPSWLNPKFLPTSAELQCSICQKPMCFLIQVYATSENDPPHSFHRTLFIFICRNPHCSKPNNASNIAVFRCCLPRRNPYYSYDGPMDPDLDGDVPDPRLPEDAPQLCEICGCYASKKCGKCGESWYCCRDHQALDWISRHKQSCGVAAEATTSLTNPLNKFVFKEYGIEMDQEYVPATLLESLNEASDDDDDDDDSTAEDESEEIKKKRMAEFENFMAKNKLQNDQFKSDELEAAVCEQQNDSSFERFNRLLSLESEQILRYQRSGTPLLATDRAPAPQGIPPCERCGAPRTFELQLMPHLLSLIEVDQIGQSIDWASVYVYTCSNSCEITNGGYAKEYVFKQDFV
ncbi:unnamed protein product [Cylicocyclus nassatus]|uniref:MYND-type domain-containing protein n=1 Tax=Cylicocyclus nassatus TaxID=53992 RepID=A0AA36M5E1_CYLNA|nr:unnamed protein product [Cylicocyclus nassatus]